MNPNKEQIEEVARKIGEAVAPLFEGFKLHQYSEQYQDDVLAAIRKHLEPLTTQTTQVESLQREIAELRASRSKVGERRHELARTNEVLQGSNGGLKDAVEVINELNESLQSQVAVMKVVLSDLKAHFNYNTVGFKLIESTLSTLPATPNYVERVRELEAAATAHLSYLKTQIVTYRMHCGEDEILATIKAEAEHLQQTLNAKGL